MRRWKSYLKGLKVKLLWHLSLKTSSLGSWSLSCAGKHCLFKGFWDAWRGAYNRACWGWKELDFILHWHLQIAKRNVAKWQSLFLETLPMKKTRNLPWKKSGQKDKTKHTSSSSRKIQNRKERWKDATSNLSDLIYDLLTIIFRNNCNIKIMGKTSLLAAWCCKKLQTSKNKIAAMKYLVGVFSIWEGSFSASYILLLVTSNTPRVTTTFHSRWSFLSAFFFCGHGPLVRALVFEFHRVKLATWLWCLQLEVFALA